MLARVHLIRTLGIWNMPRTANMEHLFFPVSCCSKGQSTFFFYQPILGFWHSFTSITSALNLLFFFVLEAPEVIDQKGTFVALFTKWAFKIVFNSFCCSLFPLLFWASGTIWLFHQLSWTKPKVQSWQKVFSMTEGEYNRGLLWPERFLAACLVHKVRMSEWAPPLEGNNTHQVQSKRAGWGKINTIIITKSVSQLYTLK